MTELVKRLIEKSVPGLQSADTEYESNSDGTLVVLPDSTLVELVDNLLIKRFGVGDTVFIPKGTQLFLPDGTGITLTDGSEVTLPGSMVVTEPRRIQFNLPKNSTYQVAIGEKLKLSNSNIEEIRIPDGRLVRLSARTEFVLLGCKPKPKLYAGIFSDEQYAQSDIVERPYPVKDLDFTSSGAYAVYNWELFYHVPFTIAIHLSKNQRFEEAQQWFHYIFDPTDDSDGPTPERFWKVKPFQYTDVKMIEELLVNLSSGTDTKLKEDTIDNIEAWRDAPFRPHVVARYRQTPYMYKTVMAYLDNLIAWGDSLFRQDTGESINDATQLYVLAANILGPRPQAVPKKGAVRPNTYASLRADLVEFGNALVEFETDIPFDIVPHPGEAADTNQFTTFRSISNALYFCVPRNDKLLSYWDTVADRLFKIHNSLNIQGTFRQLPLFEPPIDPALLAKAAAAGEALAILRARHERVILGLAETVKYGQWQEIIKAREGLEKSLLNSIQRYIYYERLLGKDESEIKIPELDALDMTALEKMKFKAGEPEVRGRNIEVDIAQGVEGISGGKIISSHEKEEIDKLSKAQTAQNVAVGLDTLAAIWRLIPEFGINVMPFGIGGDAKFGGEDIAESLRTLAAVSKGIAGQFSYEANQAAKIGSYARREQEWAFQSNLTAGEITQIYKQLRAAQIREAIAELEWKNHQRQILFAEEIEQFLTDEKTGKTTNQAFYAWMKREVKGLYAQCFQFSFDIAKKAERALQHELGNPELSYIQFGYLTGKEGLLAGEKLYLDIKRMEMAYHDLNQREYELTKHVSLLQVDPLSLLQLRTTGRCTVRLPEELFDMDGPGHYFRRIKTMSLSIPCVTGPYASVNCTLTLLKSSIRKTQVLREGIYAREDAEDERFNDYFGSLQSIVTSSAQNDSGLFETNLHDERYLPFENSGVISEWQLELPADVRQFDYDTISDVILHLRYTAREGGGLLKNGAVSNLKARIEEAQAAGSVRLFSVRHEFPTEWAKFTTVDLSADSNILAGLTLDFQNEHYPFWSKDEDNNPIVLKRVDIFAKPTKDTETNIEVFDNSDAAGDPDSMDKDSSLNDARVGKLTNIQLPAAIGEFTLYFNDNSMEDLWLALTWGK